LTRDGASISAAQVTPNPASNFINLEILAQNDNLLQVYLYNGSGKLLKKQNMPVHKGINVLNLAGLEQWPNGLYVVKMILGRELFTEKLIIQH
jgi:hypothetical protein